MFVYSDDVFDGAAGTEGRCILAVLPHLPCHQVKSVLSRGPGLEVLSQKFNISIKRDDVWTLAGLNWLNDEVFSF